MDRLRKMRAGLDSLRIFGAEVLILKCRNWTTGPNPEIPIFTERNRRSAILVGFIGLGNVGCKLSRSLLRDGAELTVHDLNADLVAGFMNRGATAGDRLVQVMRSSEIVITCLPSPAASVTLVEEMLPETGPGKT